MIICRHYKLRRLTEEEYLETPETSSQMQDLWKGIPLRKQERKTLPILPAGHRQVASLSFARANSRPAENLPALLYEAT